MKSEDRKQLLRLLKLMEAIGNETGHEDISLHQIKVLLYVALRDAQDNPADSREVAKELGLSTSGVSRAVASLGEYGRGARAGLGLIEAKPDITDRRRKPVMLSRKGLKVVGNILKEAA